MSCNKVKKIEREADPITDLNCVAKLRSISKVVGCLSYTIFLSWKNLCILWLEYSFPTKCEPLFGLNFVFQKKVHVSVRWRHEHGLFALLGVSISY